MRLIFKLVDRIKEIALLMWVDLNQSFEGLNITNRVTFPPSSLQIGTSAFFCLWIQTETLDLSGSQTCQPLN